MNTEEQLKRIVEYGEKQACTVRIRNQVSLYERSTYETDVHLPRRRRC